MKKFFLLSLTSVAILSLSSCGEHALDVYKFTYADMDQDVMPISGWIAPASVGGFNTLEQYRILKESGLNSIYGHYEQYGVNATGIDKDGKTKIYNGTDEIYKALEYAQEVGIKYFVRDGNLFHTPKENFKNVFESRNYTKYSSFAGFHYTDEPKTHEKFVEISTSYQMFRENVDDKYAFYVNLNPMEYFTYNHGTIEQYKAHVNDYLDTVKPRFMSYDMYCPYGEFPSVKAHYFKQLEIISTIANERHLPFWAFALATGHSFLNGGAYRAPTEEDIYFQVNTILAYGAKAVQYFCYQTPLFTDETSSENYHEKGGSVINEKGEKSEIFPYIQKMNHYINFVDHLLMNATKIGVMAVENNPACYLSEEILPSIRDVTDVSADNSVLVSAFDYKGKTLYYCVNTSLLYDCNFKLEFNKKINFNVYSMDLNTTKEKAASYSGFLKPGRSVILETL